VLACPGVGVFSFSGGTWKLVFVQGAFIVPPLVAVGADIKVTTPVFRSTDQARCLPTAGHDGVSGPERRHADAGPWHQVTPGQNCPGPQPSPVTPIAAGFYSVPGWWCDMSSQEVFCQNSGEPNLLSFSLAAKPKSAKRNASPATSFCALPRLATERGHQRSFQCSFANSGLTCVVVKTGRGFRINSNATVMPVGA